MLFDDHGDDLENGEEVCRHCHGGWDFQHASGRDIGSYLGRGDQNALLPVLRLMALRAMQNPRVQRLGR